MAHGHHRHSRIGKLISARRRLDSELDEKDAGSGLLEDHPFQNPILPVTVILADENCDSKNSMCLEHSMNESDPLLEKRDEATSADPTVIETVLQIVDASSHTLFQSTGTDFPMTVSDSTDAIYTLPSSDGLTATATATTTTSASVDLGPTSPTPTSATQPTASPLPETSFSSNSTISTQTSLTSTNSTSQLTSASRSTSATVINSPGWTSTPLVGPSSSMPSVTTTSTQVHTYWSYSGSSSISGSDPSSSSGSISSSSSSTAPTSNTYYITSSSDVYGGAESTGSATGTESTGSAAGTGSAPTTSETHSGHDSTIDPETSKIVGGVVGSVAGLALILFLLFYYLRRRGFFMGKMGRPPMLGDAAAGAGAGAGSREVVERRESNDPLFTASYLAPAFMKRWRQSTATARSGSTIDSAPSERGFQKISGRKLPPVFIHGGDGYGGGLDGDSPTIPGFAATSPATGPMGSPSVYAPPPTSQHGGMPLDSKFTREVEEHTPPLRSNPVHLPVSSSVNVATPITITPAHPIAQAQSAVPFAPRPDALGRSLHSFDGSRSSRFTEVIDP
ncbi:hypothetical protein N7491_005010 [Penicillium cf. griseofulvum]|uniref:Mid2 domain-containing protein n=1 Tax=Penicillium cf. griseofulvum TaxID=2972120 RepID=A0A9W9J2Q3_9EURO|nr:hypothetical protein N7472_007703 [Penicillium cf. griseofulvum]KAJ5434415.1 hypothetical protein N7491_005010 [Penicillium cf. griseofulvum]KAJ5452246.1 hypothetical protein N7445_000429 [Penicillium cf. griseofulvum]